MTGTGLGVGARRRRRGAEVGEMAEVRAALHGAGLWYPDARIGEVVAAGRGRLAFLALPWTQLAREGAGAIALEGSSVWSGALGARGLAAISPALCLLSAARALADRPDLGALDPSDSRVWADWCGPLLARADLVVVPPVLGWGEAPEVEAVCQQANLLKTPVYLIARGEI